jgi:UDP:flavonoid glycosyltransferase YjiC (YdhE family)
MTRKIVLSTLGSLGDLHPFIALGLALQARGMAPVVATSAVHRDRIEGAGVAFFAVNPDQDEALRRLGLTLAEAAKKAIADDRFTLRMMQPFLAESFRDLCEIIEGADLVLAHRIAFAAKCAAEKRGVPQVDVVLSPSLLFSAYDPPHGWPLPFVRAPSRFGRGWNRSLGRLAHGALRPLTRRASAFRAEIGLPANGDIPFLRDSVARATLGLFSPLLAEAAPDHPRGLAIVGSTFHDGAAAAPPDAEVEAFLAGGDALVFTLGSFAALGGVEILRGAIEAARRLGRRVLAIAGRDDARDLGVAPDENLLIRGYAPHSAVFGRAAAILHHGGAGTSAQALRSGRPQLIVPLFADQPDNAARVARLGVARVLPRRRFSAGRAERDLRALLEQPAYAQRAREVAATIALEDGAAEAARIVERLCEGLA